jgi:hypothetical protein
VTGRRPLEVQADRSRDLSGNAVTTTVTSHSEPLRPGRSTIEARAVGLRDRPGDDGDVALRGRALTGRARAKQAEDDVPSRHVASRRPPARGARGPVQARAARGDARGWFSATLPLLLLAALSAGCTPPPADPAPGAALEVVVGAPVAVAVGAPLTLRGEGPARGPAGDSVRGTWDFGDGTSAEATAEPTGDGRLSFVATHTWSTPANRIATLRLTTDDGRSVAAAQHVTVHEVAAVVPPRVAAPIALDAARGRLWVPVPEAGHVAVIDTRDGASLGFLPACAGAAWAHHDADRVAVTCPDAGEVVTFDAATLAEVRRWMLDPGSRPEGVVGRDGRWLVVDAARGELLTLTDAGAARAPTLPDPSVLALLPDDRVLVARFRSPADGGELAVHGPDGAATVKLARNLGPDTDTDHRGVPNLLGALVVRPGGDDALVAGLTANIDRGAHRDGRPLTFESTVRGMVRRVALDGAPRETFDRRLAFDNRDTVSSLALSPLGTWLYVGFEGNGMPARLDAFTLDIRRPFAPDGAGLRGIAVAPDGVTVYLHRWLDRRIEAVHLPLDGPERVLWSAPTVEEEPLDPVLLAGKRLFHTSDDRRLARAGYVHCATCHPDGDHDGQTWDFTDRGEGLRNTTTLLGRGGLDMGRVHWTGNFDEIQDFEVDIRHGQGGLGLLSDADWQRTSDPLGAPKAGLSAELDALAAYVHSLTALPESPWGPPTEEGEALFERAGCAACHVPATLYTDSRVGPDSPRHDVGTLGAGSGGRLGSALDGLDTPTLLGAWATAPYLHDGSAPTLADAIRRHRDVSLTDAEIDALAEFVRRL